MAVITRLDINGKNGVDGFQSYPIATNIPISINYNLADVREPDKRKASFSKTITLNGTNTLNKLFENIFSVNVATQYFNKNLKTPVKYFVDNIENFSGDLQLIKVNIKPDKSIEYECSILGEGGSLFVDIGDKYITGNTDVLDDLDFSAYDHTYDRDTQIATRSNVGTGTDVVYPFIDRGTNQIAEDTWSVEDFIPCLSAYEYIKKIIEATGRTFTSVFLESAFFKNLIIYPNIENVNLTTAQVDDCQWYAADYQGGGSVALNIQSGTYTFSLNDYAAANGIPTFDTGSQYSGSVITLNNSGKYNIVASHVMSILWTHPNPSAHTMEIVRLNVRSSIEYSTDGGTTWGSLANVSNPWKGNFINIVTAGSPSEFTNEVATGEVILNAGTMLRHEVKLDTTSGGIITAWYDISHNLLNPSGATWDLYYATINLPFAGTTFYGLLTSKSLISNNTCYVNQSLPQKIKQKDFLKSIIQAFNLFIDVDKDDANNLIIENYTEFYNGDIVDYENKTDLSKEQTINPNLLDGKKYVYTYKQDVDYYNDLYQKKYREAFGTETVIVENEFTNSDKKNELIFSPTPNVANLLMGVAIPKIYKYDAATGIKKPLAPNIRLLYCSGVKTSFYYYVDTFNATPVLPTTDYLYAGHVDDVFDPTIDLNFGLPKEVYYSYVNSYFTTNNLYNAYHSDYINNISNRDAKFITKYLWLSPKDIYLFNFRNRFFIDGAYYIVNKIENYNPLEEQSAKVELIKLLQSDVFTPSSILISDLPDVNSGEGVITVVQNSSFSRGSNNQNLGINSFVFGNGNNVSRNSSNIFIVGNNVTLPDNASNFQYINGQVSSTVIGDKGVVVSVSADYNVLAYDDCVLVTTGATNKTITLAYVLAAYLIANIDINVGGTQYTFDIGKRITIKKVDSGAGNVIIDGDGANIDGSATITLTTQYESLTLQWDGTNWNII